MVVGVVHSTCRVDLSRLDSGALQVSKQESFITLLLKLAESSAFLQDIAFATKDPKIYNVGLSTIQELTKCLLFQWVTI
jgi:hypothetical protein